MLLGMGRRGVRGLLASAVFALAALAAVPAAAGAATLSWSPPILLNPDGAEGLQAVVCPTTTQCTGVDRAGQQVTFDPRAPGDPVRKTIAAGLLLGAVDCPSTTQCTAIGTSVDGRQVTFNPRTSEIVSRSRIFFGGGSLRGVACPSVSQCTTITNDGRAITFNPTAPATQIAGVIAPIVDFPNYLNVVCPSVNQCTAVTARQLVTFDPAEPEGRNTIIRPADTGRRIFMRDVACPSTRQCSAIGFAPPVPATATSPALPAQHEQVTVDPTDPASVRRSVISDQSLVSVKCPSTSRCTAVDQGFIGGRLVRRQITFDPTNPGTPTPTELPNRFPRSSLTTNKVLACPSVSQCTVVDNVGQQVTFDPAPPAGSPAPTPVRIRSGASLPSVACPATDQCSAVDALFTPNFTVDGGVITFNPDSPGTPARSKIDEHGLSRVDCPSVRQCTALDTAGRAVTFNPAAPGTPVPIVLLPRVGAPPNDRPNPANLSDLACPSERQCTAVDDRGGQVTFDPTATSAPPRTVVLADDPRLEAVTCPSLSQCTAVDDRGRQVTFNPTAPGTPTPVTVGTSRLRAVACPSVSQCSALDNTGGDGGIVTFNPTRRTPTTVTIIDRSNFVLSIDCPAVSMCVIGDSAGRVLEGDPGRPESFEIIPLVRANVIRDVSCPSVARCVVVDDVGQGFVGTRVAAAAATEPAAAPGATAPAAGLGSGLAGATPAAKATATPRRRPGLSAAVRRQRDRGGLSRFATRGRLLLPSGVTRSAGCRGTVRIVVRRTGSRRTLSSKLASVNRTTCAFSSRFALARGRGTLQFVVRFQGNARLLPRSLTRIARYGTGGSQR